MSMATDLKQIMQPAGKPDRTTWETFLHRLWSAVEVGPDCEGCRYLKETPDMYGTGDSPADYECTGCAKNCPRLFEDECDAGRIAQRLFDETQEIRRERYGV